jgi:hypothetical protein
MTNLVAFRGRLLMAPTSKAGLLKYLLKLTEHPEVMTLLAA